MRDLSRRGAGGTSRPCVAPLLPLSLTHFKPPGAGVAAPFMALGVGTCLAPAAFPAPAR